MVKLNDWKKFEWIKEEIDRIETDNYNWTGGRVSNFIPKRFSHYCKIIHPIYRDRHIKDEKLLWNQCGPDEEQEFALGERLRLKDLADKYGLPLTKELSSYSLAAELGGVPRFWLLGDEGDIGLPSVERLVNVLEPFSGDGVVWFYYELLKTSDYTDVLYTGKLEEVVKLPEVEGLHGTPTYWWPANKSWCLYTDFDLNFSLIGGGRELVDKLLADDYLECIIVDASTCITIHSDKK